MKRIPLFVILILFLSIPSVRASFLEVPIEGTIDGGLAAFVARNVSDAEKMHADGIIFHVNTPGGRIDSAVDIKDAILNSKVKTIAFVDKSAISAGSLISMACDSIYMAAGSSIGAATAVDLEGKKASEKVISYMRAQMRATAQAKHRRTDIAEAMVDEDIAIQGLTAKGKLLTLTYTEALTVGISNGTVTGIDDILGRLGKKGAPVIESRINWAERVVRFLTDPIVSSLLLTVGFLGLIMELKAPGWGIGGTIALIALGLFFGSHYIVKLAGILEILLFTAGVLLVIFEIFIAPGFGVPGVLGIILILASFFLSLVGKMPSSRDFVTAAHTMGWTFLFTVALGYFVIRYLPHTKLFNRIIMAAVENQSEGFSSADTAGELIGMTGTATSNLRPAGKAEINGRRLDVVTEGEYILKGAAVVVTEAHGSRLVVKEVKS
jgi:membrane-bound serine protease (ClpP class)